MPLTSANGNGNGNGHANYMAIDMPIKHTHRERHTSGSEYLESAVLGMADGLTVPFALTAGLSSIGSSKLVIAGGLAELVAGAISMGLGEYLSSDVRAKQWDVEEERERREVREMPEAEEEEIYDIFAEYGVDRNGARGVVEQLRGNEEQWIAFMMAFELGLTKPHPRAAMICGLVMAVSYGLGAIIPMAPYFFIEQINHALFASIAITVVVLIIFGYAKAAIGGSTRKACLVSSIQTLCVGALAAGSSYGIVYAINQKLFGGDQAPPMFLR